MRTVTDPVGNKARNPENGWSVWGQRSAIARLQEAIQRGPKHAYILSGPSQSGKRTSALDFARALNCPIAINGISYCGECPVCRRIGKGVFPDVTVFDLASQAARDGDKSRNLTLNIATVREISSAVSYRPTESSWRIMIVDDAETMQETAQEAFLKTLEEPPSYAILILLTTDADALLSTIVSRCATIHFGLSRVAEIEAALEGTGVEPALAHRISGVAQGSVGWAVDAALDTNLIAIREELITDATRIVFANGYDRIVKAVLMADEFSKDREGVFAKLREIQSVWRSALYLRQDLGDVAGIPSLTTNPDGFRGLNVEDLVRSIRSVDDCMANLGANVRPRLALESMVFAWPRMGA